MQGTWIIERHIFASNQTYFVLADHCVLSDFGIPTSWVLVDSNDCCKYCVPLFYSSSTVQHNFANISESNNGKNCNSLTEPQRQISHLFWTYEKRGEMWCNFALSHLRRAIVAPHTVWANGMIFFHILRQIYKFISRGRGLADNAVNAAIPIDLDVVLSSRLLLPFFL